MSDFIELSVHPASSPIDLLNDDILLYIFTPNADMFLERDALHTTRVTSQVCRQWRNSMLDTSFLWARLIDLDRIHSDWKHEWRSELIRRSGAAPLWIRANSNPFRDRSLLAQPADDSRDITQFLFDLIRGNWHRIQRLVINCDCWVFCLRNNSIFCLSPAPQLEEIVIPLDGETIRTEDLGKCDIKHIFSDHAPFLRRLNLGQHTINHRAPWLSQLYVMKIDEKRSIRDVLALLSATPNLRELWIKLLGRHNISAPLPTVSLPHLTLLNYNGIPQACAALLNHIEIPIDCVLFIACTTYVDDLLRPADYLPIVNTFARHTQLHLQSRMIDTISLRYVPNDFIALEFGTSDPAFGISISLIGQGTPGYFPTTILNSVAFPELSYTTNIRFFARGHLHPYFSSFLSDLTSVHTISTKGPSLEHLMDQHSDMFSENIPNIIFPVLSAIDFYTAPPIPDNFSVKSEVASFLLTRIFLGFPIATLNLSVADMAPFNAPPNLDVLAEVKGLKVTYKLSQERGVFEYICGSGDPARRIDTI